HVAVLDLGLLGFAHLDDLDVEVQVLAGHGMVEVDIDHAHADLLHGHRARAEIGVEHHLLARCQLLRAEMLLGHALGQAIATLAVGFGGRHVDAEALAGLAPVHRLLQAGNDVAVPDQDRQRLPALLRRLQRLLADFGDGVVETDDAVFLALHGRSLARRGPRLVWTGRPVQDAPPATTPRPHPRRGRRSRALSGLPRVNANPSSAPVAAAGPARRAGPAGRLRPRPGPAHADAGRGRVHPRLAGGARRRPRGGQCGADARDQPGRHALPLRRQYPGRRVRLQRTGQLRV